jgi:ribosomal protein S8
MKSLDTIHFHSITSEHIDSILDILKDNLFIKEVKIYDQSKYVNIINNHLEYNKRYYISLVIVKIRLCIDS